MINANRGLFESATIANKTIQQKQLPAMQQMPTINITDENNQNVESAPFIDTTGHENRIISLLVGNFFCKVILLYKIIEN